ncbi:hypothetical protein ABK040_005924 [Willaertia magna]
MGQQQTITSLDTRNNNSEQQINHDNIIEEDFHSILKVKSENKEILKQFELANEKFKIQQFQLASNLFKEIISYKNLNILIELYSYFYLSLCFLNEFHLCQLSKKKSILIDMIREEEKEEINYKDEINFNDLKIIVFKICLKYLKIGIEKSENLENEEIYFNFLYFYSNCNFELENYRKSLQSLQKAIETLENNNNIKIWEKQFKNFKKKPLFNKDNLPFQNVKNQLHFEKAINYYLQRNHNKSLNEINNITEEENDILQKIEINLLKGHSYLKLQNFKLSEIEFTKILTLQQELLQKTNNQICPFNIEGLFGLSLLFLQNSNIYDQANEFILKVLKYSDRNYFKSYLFYFIAAKISLLQNKNLMCLEYLLQSISINNKDNYNSKRLFNLLKLINPSIVNNQLETLMIEEKKKKKLQHFEIKKLKNENLFILKSKDFPLKEFIGKRISNCVIHQKVLRQLEKLNHLNLLQNTIILKKEKNEIWFISEKNTKLISLEKLLSDKSIHLNWIDKINILIDVAFGLKELEKNNLIHGYLTSRNVLIKLLSDDDFNTIICDYGISSCQPIHIDSNQSAENTDYQSNNNDYSFHLERVLNGSSLIYTSPELFEIHHFTMNSDIYSFGILMYEVFFRIKPYSLNEFDCNKDYILTRENFKKYFVSDEIRPIIPSQEERFKLLNMENREFNEHELNYINLMKKCWDSDDSKRPSFEQILNILYQLYIHAYPCFQ